MLNIQDKKNNIKVLLSDKSNEAILRYYSNLDFKNFEYWSDIKKLLDKNDRSLFINDLGIEDKGRLLIKTENFDFETFLIPKYQEKLYVFLSGVGHWNTPYPFFERCSEKVWIK